jgi:hypothetical protein
MAVTSDGIFRGILLDRRATLKLRLESLAAMSRPSLRLLYKLTKDKSLKIRFQAAKLLAIELTRKEMRKRAKQRETATHN